MHGIRRVGVDRFDADLRPALGEPFAPLRQLGGLFEGAAGQQLVTRGSRPVGFLDVFLHHAVGVEDRADRAD